jgi:WD40 repeat protein
MRCRIKQQDVIQDVVGGINRRTKLSRLAEFLREHWQRQLLEDEAKLAMQLRHYIPAKLGQVNNEAVMKRVDGIGEIQEFLASNTPALLLLGDSGAGKSLFCQFLVDELWRQPIKWLPMFIHLPLIFLRPGFVFETYLQEKCHLNSQQVALLKASSKILLILDAYDEIQEHYLGSNFYQVLALHNWNIKVILSCRSEFLVNYDSVKQMAMFTPTKIGMRPMAIDRMYVQFFDPEQIPLYIERWKALNLDQVNQEINYYDELNKLPGLTMMITNPFILWAVMEVFPELLRYYVEHPKLERYDKTRKALFDRFTQGWFERQRDKLLKNHKITADWAITIVEDFHNYCQKLADYMWQIKVMSLTYDSTKSVRSPSFYSESTLESSASTDLLDNYFAADGLFNNEKGKQLVIVRQGALLRVLTGNTYNTYTFLHQSLMEYFSARRLFESAIHKATVPLGLEINSRLIIKDLPRIQTGVDCIQQYPEFEAVLRAIIEESKHEDRLEIAAANAFTILVAANKSCAGKDFRRIRIRFANLVGGNFDGCDFRDSDLRDVNISQAWLKNANLSGSCLDRLQTGELFSEELDSAVKACVFSPDGHHYVVMTKKSSIVYQTDTHKILYTHTIRLANMDYLNVLAFSPSSDLVLIGTKLGNLIVLSFPRGKLLRQWAGHAGKVTALAISPAGFWALSASTSLYYLDDSESSFFLENSDDLEDSASIVKRWAFETGTPLCNWRGNTSLVSALALSSDGLWALLGYEGGSIERRDISTGKRSGKWLEEESISELSNGRIPSITALALSADECYALSGSEDGTINRWNCMTGDCVATWKVPTCEIEAVIAFSADSCWALVGCDEGTITRMNCVTGECGASWQGHIGKVNALAWSPDGSWAISAGKDGRIKRWNHAMAGVRVSDQGHTSCITALAFSLDGRWVFSSSYDNTYKRWNCVTGECAQTNEMALEIEHQGAYRSDLDTFKLLALIHHERSSHSEDPMDFSGGNNLPHNDIVVRGSSWERLNNKVCVMAVSQDWRWALTGDDLENLKRWDCTRGERVAIWHVERHSSITALALNADGLWALSATVYDQKVMIKHWDCTTGVCLGTWAGPTDSVTALALSSDHDNRWALSGSENKTIKRWECATGKCLATWKGHQAEITAIVLSPNSRWAVSSEEFGLIIWQTSNGKICERHNFSSEVNTLLWSSIDESLIMMGMGDGNIVAWTFHEDTASLHLRWRCKPWGLQVDKCQLLNVHSDIGLDYSQQKLLEQKGAKIQLSSKGSEKILVQRNLFTPYVIGAPRSSVFDNSYIVRPSADVITVARDKLGAGSRHAFMVIENVEEVSPGVSYYRIRRIDFVLELRHSALPKGTSQPHKTDTFGQGLIEIADKSFDDAQQVAKESYHCSQGIDFMSGIKLLQAIYDDKRQRIAYCKMGNGGLYSLFTMREAVEHHNCLSWIRKHLEAIDVDLIPGKLKDFLVEDPRDKLLPAVRDKIV